MLLVLIKQQGEERVTHHSLALNLHLLHLQIHCTVQAHRRKIPWTSVLVRGIESQTSRVEVRHSNH